MHIATRILKKLSRKYEISYEQQLAVRVAALLHDIGHGAFSHVLETILDFHHESFTIEAVLSQETEVGQLLKAHSPGLAEDVASIIRGTFRPMALAQIVSSQLDADRMDYLLRDSLMTGAKYGIYDHEWIIKSIEIDEVNDRLYVSARGLYAVEDYLQARYYMFRQVYFHRTLRSAEAVLKAVIRRAMMLEERGDTVWRARGTAFERILKGERPGLREHLELDDGDIIYHIKRWQTSDDEILADLAARFLNRRLFKVFDLDMPQNERAEFLANVKQTVESAGYDPEYYFVEDKAGNVSYYFYTSDGDDPKNLIYAEDGFSSPRIMEISEISAAVRGLQKGYKIHRVCFPSELTDAVSSLYHRKSKAV